VKKKNEALVISSNVIVFLLFVGERQGGREKDKKAKSS
jgi:hypothetical protein